MWVDAKIKEEGKEKNPYRLLWINGLLSGGAMKRAVGSKETKKNCRQSQSGKRFTVTVLHLSAEKDLSRKL